MALTDTICKSAKSKDKPYRLADSGGMYLEITPAGSKLWRMKYRFHGKEKRLALGIYPIVSLAEARKSRDAAKGLLSTGVDPSQAKKEDKRRKVLKAANTFETVAREWHDIKKESWSRGYPEKVMRALEKDIFPHIGYRPIAEITPPELLDCLRKIEKRGALDTSGRCKQHCSAIFRYGIQTGRCERDAAADLKGALKTKKTEHYRTIDAKDVPAFIAALERNEARLFQRTRRAIWFSLLTFCRPGEIRQARWKEIDFDAATWSIPAERMKMKKPHIVPLSRQALAILQEQKEETGHINTEYVFPSQIRPCECMSDGTVVRAIKCLGYGEKMVAHGFRALARTTIREKLGYDSEIIEKQLAHKTRNPLGEAYDRTQFLDERKTMMQHWSDYLDALASHEKVVVGDFRKVG